MASPEGATAMRPPRLPAAERRTQLASVAAARFHRLGYHRVALADVAQDAGVTAPAVYRHFRNKQALLAAAISSGLDLVEDVLTRTSGGSLDELIAATADIGLDRPDLWILLQSQARFLDPESAAKVHEQFGRVIEGFVRRLQRERPALAPETARLLVTAATAVLSSPSMSRTSLPRETYQRVLARAALAALRIDLAAATAGADAAGPASILNDPADSRRDEVVNSAIDLFFRRGYSAVTLDDIGASVGIAGPSLYHHFATKAEILVTAFDRATSRLAAGLQRRADAAVRPALGELVSSYTEFCLENRALVGVYVSEAINLPPAAWERTSAVIHQGVREWTAALLEADRRVNEPEARVRVHAALAAIHDLVRLGQLYRRPRIAAEIAAVARAVLLPDADRAGQAPLSGGF